MFFARRSPPPPPPPQPTLFGLPLDQSIETTAAVAVAVALLSLLLLPRKRPAHLPDHKQWRAYTRKMANRGCSKTAINAFGYNFAKLTSHESLFIPEAAIAPVNDLPNYEQINYKEPELLRKTVVVKLNGGLGTGMGLEKAKSLLTIKDNTSFLDLIARQVVHMRDAFGVNIAFMLMNSFATSTDTLSALENYPNIKSASLPLEFLQNAAPKVTASDLSPASWPQNPDHEWCPPGHGDLYPALVGSGTLDKLIGQGYEYMFVSNSDNLGATLDIKLLTWFARSKAPFAMEVCKRTDADKKGGHLAQSKKTGGLLLRESAQCPEEDEKAFQDVGKYKFFNTNNLWVHLPSLKKQFDAAGGLLPLPVIKNSKTVDPRDKKSTKVFQLETAMGAAIECFPGAAAIVIPRTRFAPVKTTNDLLALSSDAYDVTSDHRMVLKPARKGIPPNVKLDSSYKFVDALKQLVPNGAPSLVSCSKLVVEGPVEFASGVKFVGEVTVKCNGPERKVLKPGTYSNKVVSL